MHDPLSSPYLKLKKLARYCRLYGPRRTYVKVQGRRHMQRRFDRLPAVSRTLDPRQVVGLVGCGNYAFSNIAYYLARRHGRVIGGCMDVDIHRAASLSQYYQAPLYTSDAAELIAHPGIRLIYIASNHASHAEHAIAALEQGKDVYIEKPHVVSEEQLDRLVVAMHHSPGRVYLGFNRPQSAFTRIMRSYLDRQTGPALYNWFVLGHDLPADHWYRNPGEGGRVLGNFCHWTDFLYAMVGREAFPIRIQPTDNPQCAEDLVVTYTFGEGSVGVISFTAKGYTFEGVRERLCVAKGDCQIAMDDFQRMTVEVLDRKRTYRPWFRDHGHEANILAAYASAIHRGPYDRAERLSYIANTAWLFLQTKAALDADRPLVIEPYYPPSAVRAA